MPVDLYVGGSEHAVLHLLYARFWHKVLFDLGVVKHPEPFSKLVHQGMILGMAYRWYAVVDRDGQPRRRRWTATIPGWAPTLKAGSGSPRRRDRSAARWLKESEISITDGRPVHPEHGVRLVPVAEKMSKSRGNVVNPDDVVREFGADSLRVYEMFMGPLEQVKPWQTVRDPGRSPLLGSSLRAGAPRPGRWTDGRGDIQAGAPDGQEGRRGHRGHALQHGHQRHDDPGKPPRRLWSKPPREALELLVLCLAPFAPHLGEELWSALGHPPSVAEAPWPDYDERWCVDEVVELGVQVNGKVRGRVSGVEGCARAGCGRGCSRGRERPEVRRGPGAAQGGLRAGPNSEPDRGVG